VTRPAGSRGGPEADGRLVGGHELDLAGVARPFTANPGRADLVQAQSASDHGQPAAVVLDLAAGVAQQPGKRVLPDILGRADVPQHLEGEVRKVGTMGVPGLDDLLVALLFGHVPPLYMRPCLQDEAARQKVTASLSVALRRPSGRGALNAWTASR
jgi:hypothetical protein